MDRIIKLNKSRCMEEDLQFHTSFLYREFKEFIFKQYPFNDKSIKDRYVWTIRMIEDTSFIQQKSGE